MKTNSLKSIITIISLPFLLFLYSCSGDVEGQMENSNPLNTKTAVVSDNSAVEMLNVAYGEHPLQVMDIYLQENRTLETPLIVLVHGGAWSTGDKADADFMKEACYNQGMNVVNLNYRLIADSLDFTCQDLMSDIGTAFNMILEHAPSYNVRTSKIVMWGGSAGGHLSLLYAYNYDVQNAVSLVITHGAPTCFDNKDELLLFPHMIGAIALLAGKPYDISSPLPQEYSDISPVRSSNLKPTLLIHGLSDFTVPIRQAWLMRDRLEQEGTDHQLFEILFGNHDGSVGWPAHKKRAQELMYEWAIRYSK